MSTMPKVPSDSYQGKGCSILKVKAFWNFWNGKAGCNVNHQDRNYHNSSLLCIVNNESCHKITFHSQSILENPLKNSVPVTDQLIRISKMKILNILNQRKRI